ncbi:oxidoreductase [Jejuia pallidilutea]|uniref:Oxidoreductase n=1 Tax=Jejuia pallidilutea TaxID=504487 RepID=A0A090WD74_9FLAO|nr:oxidoreductase [Jejuia pallidilutea]
MMQLSYWEIKSWLSNIDFCIVGSGIVGLSCALKLRELYPKAKIIILEKGILPKVPVQKMQDLPALVV